MLGLGGLLLSGVSLVGANLLCSARAGAPVVHVGWRKYLRRPHPVLRRNWLYVRRRGGRLLLDQTGPRIQYLRIAMARSEYQFSLDRKVEL
jgi:hypothetical protein